MEQTAPCPGCGDSVTFEPIFKLGNQTFAPFCPSCMAKTNREYELRAQEVRSTQRWNKICPERFRDTEFGKLPQPEKSQIAIAHSFSEGQGLNLWGVPSSGKTRTMFLILHALHDRGKSMRVFSPTNFVKELEDRAWHRAGWIHSLGRLDVVAFDDMDKLNLTGPMEKSFFGLLDQRMQNKKPCLFTHNSKAKDFEYKFKMGAALVRRIREFTKSIWFGPAPKL